jgi:hypothetical protein
LVLDTISTYNQTNLDDFGVTLRYSQLVRLIDATDDSIISNITGVSLYKKTQPVVGQTQNIFLDFGSEFAITSSEEGAGFSDSIIHSSIFTYKGEQVVIKDDGLGGLFIIRRGIKTFTPIIGVGTVNYDLGTVSLVNFNPDNFDGEYFKIYAKPRDLDIQSARRNIVTIESDEINVTVEALRI